VSRHITTRPRDVKADEIREKPAFTYGFLERDALRRGKWIGPLRWANHSEAGT
jgi:hypothetical protein